MFTYVYVNKCMKISMCIYIRIQMSILTEVISKENHFANLPQNCRIVLDIRQCFFLANLILKSGVLLFLRTGL